MSKFIFILVAVSISLQPLFPQGIIYTKEEATSLYGDPSQFVEIPSSTLKQLTNDTNGRIMFRIDEGNLIILDNNRNQLYPGNANVLPSDVFRVFSVQLIHWLIDDGGSVNTNIELRPKGVISLTNGNFTLEYGTTCPPYCE